MKNKKADIKDGMIFCCPMTDHNKEGWNPAHIELYEITLCDEDVIYVTALDPTDAILKAEEFFSCELSEGFPGWVSIKVLAGTHSTDTILIV